eukprot:1142559-Pelagomonas_calceolata.AAC.1
MGCYQHGRSAPGRAHRPASAYAVLLPQKHCTQQKGRHSLRLRSTTLTEWASFPQLMCMAHSQNWSLDYQSGAWLRRSSSQSLFLEALHVCNLCISPVHAETKRSTLGTPPGGS